MNAVELHFCNLSLDDKKMNSLSLFDVENEKKEVNITVENDNFLGYLFMSCFKPHPLKCFDMRTKRLNTYFYSDEDDKQKLIKILIEKGLI